MRFHELYEGIEVIDEQNKPIGVSQVAAKKVIIFPKDQFNWTLVLGFDGNGNDTRIFARTNSLLATVDYVSLRKVDLSIMVKSLFDHFSRNLLRRFPRLSIPLNTLACTISFGLALPMSIALFPQKSKVNITFRLFVLLILF